MYRESERETSTVTGVARKKQCDSYFSKRRGGESRVHDVMPQSRFSVTERFQHAHSLMDNPHCKGRSSCQS